MKTHAMHASAVIVLMIRNNLALILTGGCRCALRTNGPESVTAFRKLTQVIATSESKQHRPETSENGWFDAPTKRQAEANAGPSVPDCSRGTFYGTPQRVPKHGRLMTCLSRDDFLGRRGARTSVSALRYLRPTLARISAK
jgi:hypothetical protein